MSEDFKEESRPEEEVTKSFLRAVCDGDVESVEKMLSQGVHVGVSNQKGLQGIHFASKTGNMEMVEMMINCGADVNAQSLKGNTPLHVASLAGDPEVVKLLLMRGAATNLTCECNEDSFTPLYMAAQIGHQEIVTLLLANGADPLLKTSNGFTPRDIAVQQGHTVTAELLEEYMNRLEKKQNHLHHLHPNDKPIESNERHSEERGFYYVHPLSRLSRAAVKRAPAVARKDIFPSPRNSPMRNNLPRS